jgi:hypothetical protein
VAGCLFGDAEPLADVGPGQAGVAGGADVVADHGIGGLAGQGGVGDGRLQQHERVGAGGAGGHSFDHGSGVQRGLSRRQR